MKFGKILFFLCVFLFAGCDKPTELNLVDDPSLQPVNQPLQTPVPTEAEKEYDKVYDLKIRTNELKLSKYEPETGCYIGAYILSDKIIDGNISDFEKQIGKEHAIYTCNMVVGDEFPEEWFLECIAHMKTPSITINPPNQYKPYDLELLEKTAKEISTFNLPVFVHLYPYSKEMGYAAGDYVAFYRQAKDIFRELAPNAALVWSVYFEDVYDCGGFYPGDDFVDWVGISVFLDVINEGEYKDALGHINYFYYNYQKQKPVMVSELGVSHFTSENNAYYTSQAAEEIKKLYSAIRKSYPRLKAVLYMDLNYVDLSGGKHANDYSVIGEDILENIYFTSVSGDTFLSSVELIETANTKVTLKSPFPAYYKNGEYYIAHKTLEYDLNMPDLQLLSGKDTLIEGEKYYSTGAINAYRSIDFFVDNEADVMVVQIRAP